MKKFILAALLVSTISSSHALVIGENVCRDAFDCTMMITSSLPTFIVGADVKEMSDSEREVFIKAEASNFLAGVDGEYVLLKLTAQQMGSTMKKVALEILDN